MKILILYVFFFLLVWSCNTTTTGISTKLLDKQVTNNTSNVISKQQNASQKDEVTKAYSQAIAEYIKAVYKKDRSSFDTLFIGKHETSPKIILPANIQNTNIVLLTTDEADKKFLYRKSSVFLNIIERVKEDKAEFIIVTFYCTIPGIYIPQHDCIINFNYRSTQKEFELIELRFDYRYKNKAN